MLKKYIEDYNRSEEERERERNLMYDDVRRIESRIAERRKQIERLQKKLKKRRETYQKRRFPNWIEVIVKPMMQDLEESTGLHGEIYGPFGICCRTSIYLRKDMDKSITEQPVLHLTIGPPEKDGTMLYETGEQKNTFAKGTIGEMNGMNEVMKELPDTVQELVDLLQGNRELII